MRPIAALSVASLLLAACQPQAPGGGEAAPPADAPAPAAVPADFAGAFSAVGNEPFWRIDIKGTDVVLTRPGETGPDPVTVTATNAGLAATADAATWTAQAGATSVVVKVARAECSDGMSDARYDYSAEVVWGAETLRGCGFPTARQPKAEG
ncbi:MAG: hypothetical protein ACOY4K_08875 [Pseudomonadota bacterium]